jgi:type II secretory pathway pseudopilin PulG
MKLIDTKPSICRAFTLVEALTVTAIFSLLIAATVSTQVFGMKMYIISENKLLSTDAARKALNRVSDEIRAAKLIYVGTGSGSNFTSVADNVAHAGSSLKICPTTDTNNFVCYFWDSNSSSLKRQVNNASSEILAGNITNQVVFQVEDYRGNVINNHSDNRIIHMTLEFYRRQYSMSRVGNDYFHLQTRITRRVIE